MLISAVCRVTFLLLLGLAPFPAAALNMAFINPGKSDEPYWSLASAAMQQAADSLGIHLEILTAERNYLAQIHLVETLGERPRQERPDYVIVVAEKATLVPQLMAAERADIPVFLAFNSVIGPAHEQVGFPRQRFRQWLGSLVPVAEEGGYIAARALIQAALRDLPAGEPLEMIAIAGDRSTHTSMERNRGLERALNEFPQVRLLQKVYADWSYDKALEQTHHLLRRYPRTRLIWAASDLQGYAAARAARHQGLTPGRDLFISALNATPEALDAVLNDEFTALAGGHHMAGAWAMVLLYDYHHGVDFLDTEGAAELEFSMFSLLDKAAAARLVERREKNGRVDFCQFSRVCTPGLQHYDFSYARWLDI